MSEQTSSGDETDSVRQQTDSVRQASAAPDGAVDAGSQGSGSEAPASSPGAWTAVAAPGKPDGEVDTRSR